MADAIHFWAACEKAVFEANSKIDDGKVYYMFHGGEAIYGTDIGEVVRHCAEDMTRDWMIFEYVPVPSSMMAALWVWQHDDSAEPKDRTFKVRVHTKFRFPTVERVTEMRPVERRVTPLVPADPARTAAVAAIRSAANDCLANLGRRNGELDDMYREDSEDLTLIASHVEAGRDDIAKKLTARLDTNVRERIPSEAWCFVGLRPLR